MTAVIAEDATALIAWINNHGKKVISQDRLGSIVILAYLVANLTRWTTHFIAFFRLFLLRAALQLAVLQNRSPSSRLRRHILEWPRGRPRDLEPICLGTNINHKDSTRLDQVLLTIAGILRFADHPEPEVKKAMLVRLEKRWNDCDQPAFLAALILNPFEKLSCFGLNAI
ncbi:hypothetical protein B0H17DRAFT_1210361 [Mycena rosella]|uniref:Uncharacterized protein n=1 Tax=Mycena rosella TaxID=1033263 RepID=A0AAD7CX24_MYCRO|nr:hypothetical protein B0H17DRAFT_1210361 [Mycena rosella]